MTEQEPEHICSIFERCVFAIQNNLKSVSDCPTDCMFHLIRTRPYTASPTQDTTGQCKNCKNNGKRSCTYHGHHPDYKIPSPCQYKIGDDAEEALRNLNGTFIDVWTPEHDEKIRQDEREKVLEMLNKRKTLNKKVYISNPEMKELGKIRIEEIDGIIESLRAGKDGEV